MSLLALAMGDVIFMARLMKLLSVIYTVRYLVMTCRVSECFVNCMKWLHYCDHGKGKN